MPTPTSLLTRSPLDSLACVNPRCEVYGQAGQTNLTVRKTYGRDQIRYLRCRICRCEFSERKQTALWNTKIREAQAVAVAEHLAEGCSMKGTARLVDVDPSTVRRLNQRLGAHGQVFHERQVRFRIPRALAHVQVVKHKAGSRVTHVEIRYAHGSIKRVNQALEQLAVPLAARVPNTSAVERRNGTARRMSAYQVRKTLAFARRPDTKVAWGWWGVTIYNWARSHRSLRQPLPVPVGKKLRATLAGHGLGTRRPLTHRQRDPSYPALPNQGMR